MKLLVYRSQTLLHQLKLQTGRSYTIGRKDSCDVILAKDPGISREHFIIKENEMGHWSVDVLSEVMFIQVDGKEKKQFTLKDKGEFTLAPYRFEFFGEQKAATPRGNDFEPEDTDEIHENFSDIEVFKENEPVVSSKKDDKDESAHGDDKTAIQSFNGVPYLKIIGKSGKKSEFFRLEGSLWVVGGHQEASVFINEVLASKNHFEISKKDKGFFIVDSGSSAGTELNGQKLIPKKPSRLLSGDIITVGDTSLQFELRDQAFKRKVSNIPLQMYKNPLVFFDQDVAMVSLGDDSSEAGEAEQLSMDPTKGPLDRKKLIIRAVAALAVVVALVSNFMPSGTDDETKNSVIGADPFSQLAPAEQKMVKQTHRLAKQLFLAKNYELALVQLDKLHAVIPSFEDSKEIEEYCINSRELKRQKAMVEKQRQEQEQIENAVRSYLAQCNQRYATSDDIDGVKACLSPASELDPNNPGISQLITDVTARQEELKIRKKIAAEQKDKVRRGKELYERARTLHRQNNFLKAMEAYENHIHSGLPDPSRLVKTSKRQLASIESKIKREKNYLVNQAQNLYSGTKLKEAVYLGRKAQTVDPYDPKISSFLFKVEKELTNRMKNIYLDSVIEERFGNLEASRVKWEEIVKTDVSDGKYYKKAKRKLKLYGFKD